MISSLAHFLIPRSSNNHKAKLLHSSSLLFFVFIFISFQFVLQLITVKGGSVLGYAANIAPAEVERLTNIQRQNNGLLPLKDNPTLDSAAYAKGKDMFAKGYWAHVAPDGTEPWAFFVAANYNYRYAGENLARDFSDATSAVNAWMASASHRENILSPNYREFGIGVVDGKLNGVDTTIIVQFFGTKLSETQVVQPIAQTKNVTETPPATPVPVGEIVPVIIETTPAPTTKAVALVASSKVTPFDVTRFLSLTVVGFLILVVALDGFLINRRKIFRIAGRYPAHIAFLGMILAIIMIAKAGKII